MKVLIVYVVITMELQEFQATIIKLRDYRVLGHSYRE